MIPYEAVAAANKALGIASDGLTIQETVKIVLEAAAPHMLAGVDGDIDGELQDAEPSNYEEDNYDAGYIAGLTYAQEVIRNPYRPSDPGSCGTNDRP